MSSSICRASIFRGAKNAVVAFDYFSFFSARTPETQRTHSPCTVVNIPTDVHPSPRRPRITILRQVARSYSHPNARRFKEPDGLQDVIRKLLVSRRIQQSRCVYGVQIQPWKIKWFLDYFIHSLSLSVFIKLSPCDVIIMHYKLRSKAQKIIFKYM